MRRIKREKFKERHEQERMVTRERHKRHRRDGLVMEHLVPARISDKDKQDLMTFKEMRERLLNKDKIREQQMKEVSTNCQARVLIFKVLLDSAIFNLLFLFRKEKKRRRSDVRRERGLKRSEEKRSERRTKLNVKQSSDI